MYVRRATAGDALAIKAFAATMEPTFRPFGDGDPVILKGDEHWLIIDGDRRIVAYGLLRWFGTDTPSLGVAVAMGHRRRGLARAMIDLLHAVARTRGATRVMLHVDDTNHGARRLYESLGYRQAEDRWVNELG